MAHFVVPPPAQPFLNTSAGKFPVRRIYCVGADYADQGQPCKDHHPFFVKTADSVVSASDFDTTIPYPPGCEELHFQCELVVGIGVGGCSLPIEEALHLVYGYGVGVNLTRECQLKECANDIRGPWDISKGFDNSVPCGMLDPVADSVLKQEGCSMEMQLNGKVIQKTDLKSLKISEIISHISSYYRLQPGDIIITGIPVLVGKLVTGDRVECKLTGLPPCRFTMGPQGSALKQADKSVRRVVTGHDQHGQAVILLDSKAPNVYCPPLLEGVQINNVWKHFGAIPELGLSSEDSCKYSQTPLPLLPPEEGGAMFRVIEFSPDALWIEKVKDFAFDWLPLTGKDCDARHPFMHRTETIDYGVVISGEIVLVLDKEEVELKAGNVFVQRGTNHSWSNRSSVPCRVAFVLVTAKFEEELKNKFY